MFRHVGLVVKDLKAQKKFYQDFFGLEVISDEREIGPFIEKILDKKVSPQICKLGKNGKTIIELLFFGDFSIFPESSPKRVDEIGYTHFALTVSGIRRLYAKLDFAGINLLSAPTVSPSGKHCVCFCRDPEGNLIELVEEL